MIIPARRNYKARARVFQCHVPALPPTFSYGILLPIPMKIIPTFGYYFAWYFYARAHARSNHHAD